MDLTKREAARGTVPPGNYDGNQRRYEREIENNESATGLRSLTLAAPRGFTLVEMLIVIAIIANLAAAMAYAVAGAQESARVAKTPA